MGGTCLISPSISSIERTLLLDDCLIAPIEMTEAIARFSEVKGKKRPGELRPSLQQTMWETLLVEKDAESLSRARNFIADERERLASDVLIAEPFDLALAFEHRNLLDVAEVITEAAAMRTESRGSHFRADNPRRDDANWLTNIFVTRKNGHLSLFRKWVAEVDRWVDQPGDVRIKPWG